MPLYALNKYNYDLLSEVSDLEDSVNKLITNDFNRVLIKQLTRRITNGIHK